MKARLMGLLALAVAVMAVAPAAKADAVGISLWYSTNGTIWTNITTCSVAPVSPCAASNVAVGGTTITIGTVSATSNAPGTPGLSITQTENLTIAGGASGGTFFLAEVAAGFTSPSSVQLFSSQSDSSSPGVDTYSTQVTGTLIAAGNLLNPGAPAVDACSAATDIITNVPSGNSNATVSCNGVTPFDLQTISKVTIAAGSQVDLNTTVSTSAVPEPASMALFGSGLLGLAGVVRRKRAR